MYVCVCVCVRACVCAYTYARICVCVCLRLRVTCFVTRALYLVPLYDIAMNLIHQNLPLISCEESQILYDY